jgi:hydrogenase-4 component E
MSGLIDALLVVVVLAALFMLGTSRLTALVRATAVQGAALMLVPVLIRGIEFHALAIGIGSGLMKVFVIPHLLLAALRRAQVGAEVEPLIGFGKSLGIGGVVIAVAFGLGLRLEVPGEHLSPFLVPCAFATFLLGFMVIVSRTKALTQVAGFVVLENGVFIFGLILVREMPLLVEMGILLDVIIGVFIMGIMIHHISREFEHIDTHVMTALRD